MSDLPPLPPGYSLAPTAATPTATPALQSPSAVDTMPPLPEGYSLTPPKAPQQAKTVWKGAILPISQDETGASHFDPSAGVLGSVVNAFTLPGDVYTGKTPFLGPDAQVNPEVIRRATDMAATITPVEGAATIPTTRMLRNEANAGYDAYRNSGVEFHAPAVADLAQSIKQGLESNGIIAEQAPQTFAALNKTISDAVPGSIATPANMQAVRESLSGLFGGKEGRAAASARDQLDGFLSSPPDGAVAASPTMDPTRAAEIYRTANANYGAAQRSNDITGALDRATTGIGERAEARAHASNSGANIDNSIRQRVASFMQDPQNVRGFSDDEIAALNNVIQGNLAQNTARKVGNVFGGGGGLGQLAAGFGGALIGGHIAGAEGGALGAMLPTATGVSAKAIENGLARSSLNAADETIRSRSPMADWLGTNQYRVDGQYGGQLPPAFNHYSTVVRALLPGLFNPLPPPLNGLIGGPQPQPAQPQSGARPATAADLAKLLQGWT